MTRHRLERTDGNTAKYWEIEAVDEVVFLRFGRVGRLGQSQTERYPDAARAATGAAEWVARKQAEGFALVGASPAPKAVAPTPLAPTRTTLARGEARFLVYQWDARVIADGHAQAFDTVALARAHVDRMLQTRARAGYAVVGVEAISEADFELAGTQESVRLEVVGGRATLTFEEALAPAALARVLQRVRAADPAYLQVICDPAWPGDAWATALAAEPLPSVRALVFDTHFQTQTRQAENAFGSLTATLAALPALERLFATGALALSPCRHDRLEELHLLGNPLSSELLEALAACEFPALQRLVLSLTSDAAPSHDDPAEEAAALARVLVLRAPNLAHLHVESCADVALTLDALAEAGLPPALRTLGLSGPVDEDALLAAVNARAAALAQLDRLALPVGEVSTGAEADLQRLVARIDDVDEDRDLTLPATYTGW